jgi:hypothetical protein
MTPPVDTERYENHCFPGAIISHGIWLYYRFTLSYRDVQELLFERGITVSHEAIRQWCWKFAHSTQFSGGVWKFSSTKKNLRGVYSLSNEADGRIRAPTPLLYLSIVPYVTNSKLTFYLREQCLG